MLAADVLALSDVPAEKFFVTRHSMDCGTVISMPIRASQAVIIWWEWIPVVRAVEAAFSDAESATVPPGGPCRRSRWL